MTELSSNVIVNVVIPVAHIRKVCPHVSRELKAPSREETEKVVEVVVCI